MVRSILLRANHITKEFGEIQGIRRIANLIIDYANFLVALSDLQHRLDEILPV